MVGRTLQEQGFTEEVHMKHIAVKEAVLPFNKFPGVDTLLGPEMKSTGEVMGIDMDFGLAFQKAQLGAGVRLPVEGTVFVSVNDRDKEGVIPIAQKLSDLNFKLIATRGTATYLQAQNIPCEIILKIQEGRPNVLDAIKNGDIAIMINTPAGEQSQAADPEIRRAAIQYGLPYTTTLAGAIAAVEGITSLKRNSKISIRSLQEYHAQ